MSIFPRKSNLGGSIPSKKFAPAARANLPQRYRDAINKIFYLRTSHRLVGRKTPIQAAENTRGGRLGARAETEARLFRYVSLYYTGRVPARKEHSPKDRMFPWLTRSQQAKSGRKPSRHFTASSWEGIPSCTNLPIGRTMVFLSGRRRHQFSENPHCMGAPIPVLESRRNYGCSDAAPQARKF